MLNMMALKWLANTCTDGNPELRPLTKEDKVVLILNEVVLILKEKDIAVMLLYYRGQ